MTDKKINIYFDKNNQIDVTLEDNTVWLSLKQISEIFERDKSVISRHLKNIFETEELERDATVAKKATVEQEGNRSVTRIIEYYNLDVILSVGYRVNSKKGAEFRQWASKLIIKTLLTKQRNKYLREIHRLEKETQKLSNIQKKQPFLFDVIKYGYTIEGTIENIQKAKQKLEHDLRAFSVNNFNSKKRFQHETKSITNRYQRSFQLLYQYDSNELTTENLNFSAPEFIEYSDALNEIKDLKTELMIRGEASELFGREKDKTFQGVLGNICQSFDGEYLYPSIEEKAANLLYLTIKNHPFIDGNKRIDAYMFVLFLEKNQFSLKLDYTPKIDDNALVTLTLNVAKSNANDKDTQIKLIMNSIKET